MVVTVAGQKLTTTIGSGGQWSVSLGALSEGVHHVVASVTDPSQNTGTATQTLTIDTTPPSWYRWRAEPGDEQRHPDDLGNHR